MPLYLGIDTTAHGLVAPLIRVDGASRTVVFDRPIIHHDPLFALDRVFFDLAMLAEMPIEELRVIAVSSIDEARLSALMPLVADRVEYGGSARLAASWRDRYSLPPATILASPPQLPVEAIGLGVISDSMLGVILSSEDVVVGSGGRLSFRNGDVARESLRFPYGLDEDGVAQALAGAAGNDSRGDSAVARRGGDAAGRLRRPSAIRVRPTLANAERARTGRGPDDGDGESRVGDQFGTGQSNRRHRSGRDQPCAAANHGERFRRRREPA